MLEGRGHLFSLSLSLPSLSGVLLPLEPSLELSLRGTLRFAFLERSKRLDSSHRREAS